MLDSQEGEAQDTRCTYVELIEAVSSSAPRVMTKVYVRVGIDEKMHDYIDVRVYEHNY